MSDIITPIYGGKATITFKPKPHHLYTVDVPSKGITNLWQPGVTSIIGMKDKSGALVPWAVDEMVKRVQQLMASDPNPTISKELCNAVLLSAKETWRSTRDKAANIGTYVHNFLEAELKHRAGLEPPPALPIDMPEEFRERVNNSISAGAKFFDAHRIQLVQAEAPRWSATYGYIGTGDVIAFVDDELTAIDYKTSKRLYDTVFLQLAAYQKAYEEEFPSQKIVKRLGINVGRDGRLTTESRGNDTLETDFQCFLALLRLWRWDRENQGSYSKPAPAIVGPIN
jgi:hypothetical protein